MIYNKEFVDAVKQEQEKLEMTQADFSAWIGVSQGAMSKFYKRGIKDGIVTRVLARFPHLAHFFVSKHSS